MNPSKKMPAIKYDESVAKSAAMRIEEIVKDHCYPNGPAWEAWRTGDSLRFVFRNAASRNGPAFGAEFNLRRLVLDDMLEIEVPHLVESVVRKCLREIEVANNEPI